MANSWHEEVRQYFQAGGGGKKMNPGIREMPEKLERKQDMEESYKP